MSIKPEKGCFTQRPDSWLPLSGMHMKFRKCGGTGHQPGGCPRFSELDPSQAPARDPATGELLFGWSNVCMHWFTVAFLRAAAERLQREAAYHVAQKQIPSVDGPVKVLSVGHVGSTHSRRMWVIGTGDDHVHQAHALRGLCPALSMASLRRAWCPFARL